jgi:molybdate transport system ATP-binding protein
VTLSTELPRGSSVRSRLAGEVAAIETQGPLAIVEMALDGDGRLFAMATRRAVDELGLVAGKRVFALIKTVALDERVVG